MKGVLVVKFDEERGYIPILVTPSNLRKRKYASLYKEIARNAIGFGTQVEYQAFSLSESDGSPEIHCLAKRFSISVIEARGGATLYALVAFSGESDDFDKGILGDSADQLVSNWQNRTQILKNVYNSSFKQADVLDSPDLESSPSLSTESRPALPGELFIEAEGFFAAGITLTRNLLMVLSIIAMFWILFSNYNIFSFWFMLVSGVFVFAILSKKDKSLKIVEGFLFLFIILIFITLSFRLFGDPSVIWFLGTYPDFSRPDLALLSFLSGILMSLGLDRGVAVDKGSFIIGFCGTVFLILYFFTPVFQILWSIIQGL